MVSEKKRVLRDSYGQFDNTYDFEGDNGAVGDLGLTEEVAAIRCSLEGNASVGNRGSLECLET